MPRPKTHREKPTPRYAEPHTVEIADLESWSEMIAKPPYSYLPRTLPQNVLSLMLTELWNRGRRYVRIYLPSEIFVGSYRNNPAMFAQVIRNTKRVPFQFVTLRYEGDANRFRLTGSETAPQKRNSYMGTAVASLLGEMAKHGESGFSVLYPYEGMPQAYSNDQFVFRHRLEKAFRKSTECAEERLRIAVANNGYRITRVPKDFP